MKNATGTKATYHGHACVALPFFLVDGVEDTQLWQFDGQFGWGPTPNNKDDVERGLRSDKTYLWIAYNDRHLKIFEGGYHCIICNNHNKWAEANMTENRHLCHSCKDSYKWKFKEEEFIT